MKIRDLFKLGISKLLLPLLFTKFVNKSTTIQEDVIRTFEARNCKAKKDSVKEKFFHLMKHYPEFAFIFFWRIKPKFQWIKFVYTSKMDCKIFGSTKIEGGLVCYHPFATVINAKSIGKNFEFRNCLTIGNKNNDNSLLPVLGNNITVGTNVSIIGDIVLGDNIIIGAGSVVVKDVPSNSIIAGNPAKLIKQI